jgi:hypothetical protein
VPFRTIDRLRSVCVDHASPLSARTRVTAARSTLAIIGLFEAFNVAPVVLAFEA